MRRRSASSTIPPLPRKRRELRLRAARNPNYIRRKKLGRSSSSGDAPESIAPATGRLGILTPGLGAVATTFMAGVESIRRGHSKPIGSLTQMATIRLGKRTDKRAPLIKEFVPLADLDDIVFGAWDPIPDDALTAAKKAGVLEDRDIDPIADFLRKIKP